MSSGALSSGPSPGTKPAPPRRCRASTAPAPGTPPMRRLRPPARGSRHRHPGGGGACRIVRPGQVSRCVVDSHGAGAAVGEAVVARSRARPGVSVLAPVKSRKSSTVCANESTVLVSVAQPECDRFAGGQCHVVLHGERNLGTGVAGVVVRVGEGDAGLRRATARHPRRSSPRSKRSRRTRSCRARPPMTNTAGASAAAGGGEADDGNERLLRRSRRRRSVPLLVVTCGAWRLPVALAPRWRPDSEHAMSTA